MSKLAERIAELEAQAAGLREALLMARRFVGHAHDCSSFRSNQAGDCDCNAPLADMAQIAAALATDAGKAVLERLRRAETERAAFLGDLYRVTERAETQVLRERAAKAERERERERDEAMAKYSCEASWGAQATARAADAVRDANAARIQALTEMRERCAKVAEDWIRLGSANISAAIRALPLEEGT